MERVLVPRGSIIETIDLELSENDIEKDMGLLFERIKENTDGEGWSLFSSLTTGSNSQDIIYTLMCVLHMVQTGEIDVRQDRLFDEIFIQLLKKN